MQIPARLPESALSSPRFAEGFVGERRVRETPGPKIRV